jgi:hypothetical protein
MRSKAGLTYTIGWPGSCALAITMPLCAAASALSCSRSARSASACSLRSRSQTVNSGCPSLSTRVTATSAGNSAPFARRAVSGTRLPVAAGTVGPSTSASGRPSIVSRRWPKVISAAGFHSITVPSSSIVTMGSSAPSSTDRVSAALRRAHRWARSRSMYCPSWVPIEAISASRSPSGCRTSDEKNSIAPTTSPASSIGNANAERSPSDAVSRTRWERAMRATSSTQIARHSAHARPGIPSPRANVVFCDNAVNAAASTPWICQMSRQRSSCRSWSTTHIAPSSQPMKRPTASSAQGAASRSDRASASARVAAS